MAEQTPTPTTHPYASPTTPPGHVVHHAEMPEEHPERHEHSDVSVRGIWITVAAIAVTAVIVHVLLYVLFFAYESAQKAEDEAERRSAIEAVTGPPSEVPRLQGIQGLHADTPAVDMMKLEQENRRLLNSYARTEDGRARIPINRAMDLALERNLFPVRAGAAAATTQSTTQPAGGSDAGQ